MEQRNSDCYIPKTGKIKSQTDEKSYIEYHGEYIPLSDFNKFVIQNNKTFMFNQDKNLKIPIDLDNDDDIILFDINETDLQRFKNQVTNVIIVPDEYKNKYCVIFSNKVFYSFNTRPELDSFIKDPKRNCGLTFTFYYPPSN